MYRVSQKYPGAVLNLQKHKKYLTTSKLPETHNLIIVLFKFFKFLFFLWKAVPPKIECVANIMLITFSFI